MKLIRYQTSASKEELLSVLSDNEKVNKNAGAETQRGTPHMHVKEKGGKIKIKCEYVGRAVKDNAFIDGTVFRGKITEKPGVTELKGLISTAVIFHVALIAFFIVFIALCIERQGFSIVPICVVLFDIFMYKDEFKKQGIIERYVYRAVKISDREKNTSNR